MDREGSVIIVKFIREVAKPSAVEVGPIAITVCEGTISSTHFEVSDYQNKLVFLL